MKEVFRIAFTKDIRSEFDKARAKPVGVKCNAFVRAILRDHPELRGETVYFPRQGVFGYTAIIGDLVFKAARAEQHREGNRWEGDLAQFSRALARERKVLRHLKGKGLPVPEFMGEGDDPPYYCMVRCTGIKLEQQKLDEMTAQQRRRIAKDLAGFMAGLAKAFSAEEAQNMGLAGLMEEEYITPEKFTELLDDPAVAKALGGNLDFCRQMQAEFAKKYAEDRRNNNMVASHGDLWSDNILYDPVAKRIDGKGGCVIDLGLCRYSRPVREFAALSCFYKEDFVAAVCKEYAKLTGDNLSFRDVKVVECAQIVSSVKQFLEAEPENRQRQVPHLLEKIAVVKKNLAPRTKPRRPATPRINNHIG